MSVVAYCHIDPLLDDPLPQDFWGAKVVEVYSDQGPLDGDRPQLQRLLQDCRGPNDRHGTITQVRVRHIWELGGTVEAIAALLTDLSTAGVTLQAVGADGTETLDLPSTQADWMALTTQIEADHRRRRLQLGHARNRVKVLPPPGRAPYGYRRGKERYALDRATAPVVKDFFERFLLFGSVRGAVRYLGKTYGKRIAVSTGQRWLTHPVYRGDLLFQDGAVIRDTHTPILSRDEAAQIDRLLRRNRRLPPRTASASRSLAGLVQCQECQSNLKVAPVSRPRQRQKYLYLRPIACGRKIQADAHGSPQKACKAIAYDAVLDQTIAAVCRELPKAIAHLNPAMPAQVKTQLQSQVTQKQAALGQIPVLLADGILDQATADLRTYTLRSELAALEQQLSQLPPANLPQLAQNLAQPEFWQDLSEAERRVYLREFIRQVQLVRDGADWTVQIQFVF
ncbi:MAG: recombinase family protein [Cyanobacteria bacterium]|nr:recombinase family protein [Cyanobacteriota bacterium]